MHPLLRSPTGAVSCNGPGLATRSRRSRRKTAAKTSIPYLTIIDNNACNLSMILDTREKTFFTGHPLYRLITTAGASGAVWHATVFPVPGVVRRRGPGGHRSTPGPARIGPGEVALRAGSSLLPAPRPSLPPSHLSKIQELSLYYGIHRKIEKWLFGARGILEKFDRPSPDWPVFSEEFEQWAPAGIPEKTRESVEPPAGRDCRGCTLWRSTREPLSQPKREEHDAHQPFGRQPARSATCCGR